MFPAVVAEEIGAVLAELDGADTGGGGPTAVSLRTNVDRTRVPIERPARPDRGDFSSPVALRWASTKPAARRLAELLAVRVRAMDGVTCCEAVGDGFLNLRLDASALAGIARCVIVAGPAYGIDSSRSAHGTASAVRSPLAGQLAHEVRWAHVRLVAALRAGVSLGAWSGVWGRPDLADLAAEVLVADDTRRLLCAVAEFPTVVRSAAAGRVFGEYLSELVGLVASFEQADKIVPQGADEPTSLHRTRLVVAEAGRTVLSNALRRCGEQPPLRM